MTLKSLCAAIAVSLASSPALADIQARFIEGAPKDRFEITALSDCPAGPLEIEIDLKGSAGGLIFDTARQGAGVEVFQPFELVRGGDLVTTAPNVLDGDTALVVALSALPKGQSVVFTLDVDDTGGAREITVTGAEIAGALLRVSRAAGTQDATFDAAARALAPLGDCAS